MRLAERAGLHDLLHGHLTVASPNAPVKAASVIGGMLAGADCIDDLDVLRHGGMGKVFSGVRAPSTRVWASRLAQLVAASIYLGFVAVATPVMGLGTAEGPDGTLLDITARVAPWLALPLVLSAVLSQFSAAVADTVAAEGNLRGLSRFMRGPTPYLVSGGAAILLAATTPTFTIVAVASRAFAAYYAIQAVLAMRTSTGRTRKVGYGALAVVLAAVTLFAQSAG